MRPVDAILGNRRRVPGMAQVVSVAPADGSCTVLLADGEVDARLADHMLLAGPTAAVVPGDVVALLPIGDTYLVIASVGSSAGAGGTAPSLGSNLLPNPSFEFGDALPDGWGGYPWLTGSTDSVRDVTPGESVAGSARSLHHHPGGADTVATTWTTAALMVDAGKTYRVSVWLKASEVAPTLSCASFVYTAATAAGAEPFAAGVTLAITGTITAPGSAYQLMSGDVTVPAGHGFARVHLRSESDHPTPLTVSWDEAAFQQRIT